ncbi:hypothetical protein KZZ08_00525 [Roseovarius mucosus]|uniref:hypothetical protein n=1 Tax=Roseovarius mucosus TaxID=215743 RepID=UPI001C5E3A39|nr:hypothetical protein [Roseovarius mucosus]MBW4972080.1 hypothetical protein [Roseovarius mucosus]
MTTRTRPVQNTFSSGEIDPLLQSRNDFQRWQTGLRNCVGFIPLRQGGVTRAPGTIFRGFTEFSRPARRIPFQFAVNDSLTLEFTNQLMRVWRYGALVTEPTGDPYALETPYLEADLPHLDFVQDGDVIYLVDGRQPMQKLSRFALDNWTIAPAVLENGPFRVQNLDESKTIQASGLLGVVAKWAANETLTIGALRKNAGKVYEVFAANTGSQALISAGPNPPTHTSGTQVYSFDATIPGGEGGNTETRSITWLFRFATEAEGNVTLSGSASIFEPDHVGSLFKLEPTDFKEVPIWVGNAPATVGDLMRFDGNIYRLSAGDITGVNPPVHTSGAVRTDASEDTEWTFVSTEVGIVRITEVTNPNLAKADVLKSLPQPLIDGPTYRWSEGAWSAKYGYPARVENFEQRLFAARTPTDPRTLWASTQGLLTDFEPSSEADGSFAFSIEGNDSKNPIEWLQYGRRGIYIGALGEVHRGFSAQAGDAIGPLTFDTELVATDGVAPVPPVIPYGDPVYITADRARAQEVRFSFEQDGSRPIELSLPSQHLGAVGFEQIVWQSAPHRRAWLRRGDGTLAVMIHDPEQDILGWAPIPVAGGFVEDMDITKSENGAFDILTMTIRRTIDGQTVRMVEEMAINFPALLGADPISHSNHAFCSSVFEPDTPQTEFTLPHLRGQTVYAWTDRGEFGPYLADPDGVVTLEVAVSRAIIGLVDTTHYFETLNLVAAGREGDTRGIRRRLHSPLGLEVYQTVAGTVCTVERTFGRPDVVGPEHDIVPRGAGLDIAAPASGTLRINAPSGHADQVHLRVKPKGLAPLTVTALIVTIEEAGP